jgi:histidine triad (HIT) family protein
MDCIFCRIAAGEIPARIVYQDDQVIAFADIHPVAPVHVLIIPRVHITDVLQLSADPDGSGVMTALLQAASAVAEITGVAGTGFRLISNCGPDGGQTVPHVHVHLIGGRSLGAGLV